MKYLNKKNQSFFRNFKHFKDVILCVNTEIIQICFFLTNLFTLLKEDFIMSYEL